jgi:hypothetical protein
MELNQNNLLNNYYNLINKRVNINNAILSNNTLNAAYNDSSIIVTSRYYEYIALLLTAILLIMLFFRFNTSNVQSGGSKCLNYNILKFILIGSFVLFYFNRKKIYNQFIM